MATSKQLSASENPQRFREARIYRYQVGQRETAVKLTFIPGNLNFERAMKIIRGAQKDGAYTQLSAPDKGDLVFLAVIADLTNSNTVGDTKAHLDALYRSDGSRVEQVKKELLANYAPVS